MLLNPKSGRDKRDSWKGRGGTHTIDFDVAVLVQQQILRLEVAMYHKVGVAVLKAANDLSEELPGFALTKAPSRNNVVKQLASRCELEYQVSGAGSEVEAKTLVVLGKLLN